MWSRPLWILRYIYRRSVRPRSDLWSAGCIYIHHYLKQHIMNINVYKLERGKQAILYVNIWQKKQQNSAIFFLFPKIIKILNEHWEGVWRFVFFYFALSFYSKINAIIYVQTIFFKNQWTLKWNLPQTLHFSQVNWHPISMTAVLFSQMLKWDCRYWQ